MFSLKLFWCEEETVETIFFPTDELGQHRTGLENIAIYIIIQYIWQ